MVYIAIGPSPLSFLGLPTYQQLCRPIMVLSMVKAANREQTPMLVVITETFLCFYCLHCHPDQFFSSSRCCCRWPWSPLG